MDIKEAIKVERTSIFILIITGFIYIKLEKYFLILKFTTVMPFFNNLQCVLVYLSYFATFLFYCIFNYTFEIYVSPLIDIFIIYMQYFVSCLEKLFLLTIVTVLIFLHI